MLLSLLHISCSSCDFVGTGISYLKYVPFPALNVSVAVISNVFKSNHKAISQVFLFANKKVVFKFFAISMGSKL